MIAAGKSADDDCECHRSDQLLSCTRDSFVNPGPLVSFRAKSYPLITLFTSDAKLWLYEYLG